jgi:hypothetical protein
MRSVRVPVLRRASLWFFLLLAGAAAGGVAVHAWQRPAPADELPPRRVEATIFLPLKGNPDHPFTQAEWDRAVDLLVAEFGGATLSAPLEGGWRDAHGRVLREAVRPVIVSFERERLADFRRAADEVGRRLGQEAVYIRYEEPRIELRPVHPPGSPK